METTSFVILIICYIVWLYDYIKGSKSLLSVLEENVKKETLRTNKTWLIWSGIIPTLLIIIALTI